MVSQIVRVLVFMCLGIDRSCVPADDEDEDSLTLRSGGCGTGTFYTIRPIFIALHSGIEDTKRIKITAH